MAYIGGKQFQFSDRFTLSRTTQEIWTTDAEFVKFLYLIALAIEVEFCV